MRRRALGPAVSVRSARRRPAGIPEMSPRMRARTVCSVPHAFSASLAIGAAMRAHWFGPIRPRLPHWPRLARSRRGAGPAWRPPRLPRPGPGSGFGSVWSRVEAGVPQSNSGSCRGSHTALRIAGRSGGAPRGLPAKFGPARAIRFPPDAAPSVFGRFAVFHVRRFRRSLPEYGVLVSSLPCRAKINLCPARAPFRSARRDPPHPGAPRQFRRQHGGAVHRVGG